MNPFIESLALRSTETNAIVLVEGASGNTITASELLAASREVAGRLWALGVRKEDHIIMSLAASPDYYAVLYGCFMIGAIPSLVDVTQEKSQLVECVDELKPVLWLSDNKIDGFTTCSLKELLTTEPALYSEAIVSDSAVCLLLYTTGTTGRPKGVPWTIGQLKSQAQELNRFHSIIETEFVLFPYLALATIYNGRKAIIPETNSLQPNLMPVGSILSQMEQYGCDYIFASPAFWERVIEHLENKSACIDFMKIISTAGASLSLNMLSKLNALLTQGDIYIPYASTEALLPLTLIHYRDFRALSRSKTALGEGIPLGTVCDGIQMRIISADCESPVARPLSTNTIGEIIVTGERVTSEYFRRPDLTKLTKVQIPESPVIWHKMGDLGYVDDNGVVWFMTRKKYAITTKNGYFCPDAIEQFINLHSGISSCAVIWNNEQQITIVIPKSEQGLFEPELIINKLVGLGYELSNIMYYPTLLPTDKRHNSKIDRDKLKSWVSRELKPKELKGVV
ncbi:AMP-binding protein [Vibrio sp. NTOU-M3]|uniref:AMP-binding protein n=1 Tax=Vibrio sp. NTOU-M3 TaxID=3234954 RepID=UPI00349FB252